MSETNIIEFTIIYNRHKKKLYNYLLKLVSDTMLAEDILQTVFLKFYQNLPGMKNKSGAELWLFRTARNEAFTHFRSRKVQNREVLPDDDDFDISDKALFESEMELKEVGELISEELEKMTYENREVFILKEFNGFSYSEIASILGMDEQSVKSRLFKVRRKIIDKISVKIR